MAEPAAPKTILIQTGPATRQWHLVLRDRLVAAGYDVSLAPQPGKPETTLDRLVAFERRLGRQGGLLGLVPAAPVGAGAAPDLVIALDGVSGQTQDAPLLALRPTVSQGLATLLAHDGQVTLELVQGGAVLARAEPMIDDRVWLSRAADSLLASAITLAVQGADWFFADRLSPLPLQTQPRSPALASAYMRNLARGLSTRLLRRLRRERPFYWQVAWRRLEGAGVAETGRLDGPAFTVLPDDGTRFYADPFVIEHAGYPYLFVEDFPYALGRGVISVSRFEQGRFTTPRIVLEEPHHLSYPQVFARGGTFFMIPESAAAREVVLYRATTFPEQWVRDTVLIADRDINDATLYERDGRFWLFATERLEPGSASDTLVVFSAPALRGPYAEHCDNPIAIHRAAARPGGAVTGTPDVPMLPVQDGTGSYGSGLSLVPLLKVSDAAIALGPRQPVLPGAAWPGRSIHTLNRAGTIEVVDSSARKRR